jgi:hypothetical protein
MSIEDFEFVTLSIDTEIKPFVCRDEDLNQFLLEDALLSKEKFSDMI